MTTDHWPDEWIAKQFEINADLFPNNPTEVDPLLDESEYYSGYEYASGGQPLGETSVYILGDDDLSSIASNSGQNKEHCQISSQEHVHQRQRILAITNEMEINTEQQYNSHKEGIY